jgi:hypothetical protein
LWVCSKIVAERKCIPLNGYIRRVGSKISKLSFYLGKLGKRKKLKPKAHRKKYSMIITAGIKKIME